MSPSRMGGPAGAADTTLSLRRSIGAGLGLKEGFMRERVAQLEADLKMAQQREGLLEAEAMQVWRCGGGSCFVIRFRRSSHWRIPWHGSHGR